jgi:hypothetical protein
MMGANINGEERARFCYGVLNPYPGLIMRTYVVLIGNQPVLAFRAEDDDEARAMIDDDSMRSDLQMLAGPDGKPLWDGKSPLQTLEATPAQHAEWEQTRDQAISEGEIDLDAGDNPDEWNVYLVSIQSKKKNGQRIN